VHVTLPLYSNLRTSGIYGRATNVTAPQRTWPSTPKSPRRRGAKTIDWTARLSTPKARGARADRSTVVPAGGKVISRNGNARSAQALGARQPHVYKLESR